MSTTLSTLRDSILIEHLGYDAVELEDSATLEELEVDSLTTVELTTLVKQHLGVDLSDVILEGSMTLADLYSLVEERSAKVPS